MRRVWLVDDRIPSHAAFPTLNPRLDSRIVRHLLDSVDEAHWEEPEVRRLCDALCTPEYDPLFFLSPNDMITALDSGASPPHVVIFDWEYPGFNDERNRVALDQLLRGRFTYVQVYTHLASPNVETTVAALRETHSVRVLPVRLKHDVNPQQLSEQIKAAWEKTIAGELADKVRGQVLQAVEQSLLEMCLVGKATIKAISNGTLENLVHVVLAKVRDELGAGANEALTELVSGSSPGASEEDLRRLTSIWYYFFPNDDLVRCGDIIELEDSLGLVVTPPCDLFRFKKKTGSRLTWLNIVPFEALNGPTLGIKLDKAGASMTSDHGEAGDKLVLLPNLPAAPRKRDSLKDYVALCHAWQSRAINNPGDLALTYSSAAPIRRRCTLSEPLAGAVVARAASVIASPGTPDFPKAEQSRINKLLAPAGKK